MGFTALDGLPMGTRCGSIDPGVVLYLIDELRMDGRSIEKLLYQKSGLLGVSGTSSDMRTLLASRCARARFAVELFVVPHRPGARLARRCSRRPGRPGVHGWHRRACEPDPRTGDPGRGLARPRARSCRQHPGRSRITRATSRIPAYVIPADEELMIARHTRNLIAGSGQFAA